jgi:hypothetical protein
MPVIKKLSNLEDLSIYVHYLTNFGLEQLACCQQLKMLDLTFYAEAKTHQLDCLQQLKNLTSLTFHDGFIFDDADLSFISELTNLGALNFDRCYNVSNNLLAHLKSSNISSLSISSTRKVSCDWAADNPQLAKSLQSLSLKNCAEITAESLKPLAHLQCLQSLVLEDFCTWRSSPRGVQEIPTATLEALLPLKEIASLRHLTIKKCSNLIEEEIISLRQAMPQLETFTLEQNCAV